MSPWPRVASTAATTLNKRLDEIQWMLASKKLKALLKTLDESLSMQEIAIKDLKSWLGKNGVDVPEGVSFKVPPVKPAAPEGHLQVTIDIAVQRPGGSSKA